LRILKNRALGAGLNCNECISHIEEQEVSCKNAPVCKLWKLHKFRKSFVTWLKKAGVGERKIMEYTGHSDLQTILLYIADDDEGNIEIDGQIASAFGAIA
jgi:integrase